MDARIVVLVPRRDGFADRDRLWAFTRPWWEREFPDWPMFVGEHTEGLFNRSAAVNEAARLAGDWDAAVLIDSDVLTDPGQVRVAVATALDEGQMTVPFVTRYNLSKEGTERILAGYDGSWRGFIRRTFRHQHSSVVVIPRTLYDDIGGFDEGFRGWGMEDTAFAKACVVARNRPLIHLPGEVWHLYHDAAPGEKHGSPSHRRNMARLALYEEAERRGDREAIRALVVDGATLPATPQDRIPAILHRVVPESTNDVAEAWWRRFAELHPGWRLLTHRDPLDPAEWPLTSPYWARVQAGAQLADLVRLEALYRYGGVYVDQDVQPFRSFEPLLSLHVFAAWEDASTIPNAVLGARPGHPVIKECLDLAIRRMRRGVWAAGPGVTTSLLRNRADVLVLPPGSFYPVHYRDPARDSMMRDFDPAANPWTFGLHHYWGSWLPEEDRRVPDPGSRTTGERAA